MNRPFGMNNLRSNTTTDNAAFNGVTVILSENGGVIIEVNKTSSDNTGKRAIYTAGSIDDAIVIIRNKLLGLQP